LQVKQDWTSFSLQEDEEYDLKSIEKRWHDHAFNLIGFAQLKLLRLRYSLFFENVVVSSKRRLTGQLFNAYFA